MVGVIPGDIDMSIKPVGRGYVKLNVTKNHLWGIKENILINAHEFHHANILFEKNVPGNSNLGRPDLSKLSI